MTKAESIISPRGMRQVLSEDASESDDHVNDDIKRMSLDAMKLLDSITDEVNEIANGGGGDYSSNQSGSSSRRRSTTTSKFKARSVSPTSDDEDEDARGEEHEEDDNAHNAHATAHDMALASPSFDSTSPKQVNPTSTSTIKHIDDLDIGSDDEDDDNMSFDGSLGSIGDDSILKEMEALNLVTKEIEKELTRADDTTLQQKLLELQHSPQATLRQRIVDNNDREIINKILEEEGMITSGESATKKGDWEHIVEKLASISTQQTTCILASTTTIVWSIVVGLIYKSLYGDLI